MKDIPLSWTKEYYMHKNVIAETIASNLILNRESPDLSRDSRMGFENEAGIAKDKSVLSIFGSKTPSEAC